MIFMNVRSGQAAFRPQTGFAQQACLFDDRIGGCDDMRIDPMEIANDIDEERAPPQVYPTSSGALTEMLVDQPILHATKLILLCGEAPCGFDIAGGEYAGRQSQGLVDDKTEIVE